MKYFFGFLLALCSSIGLAAYGLYDQYGPIAYWPTAETIIDQLQAQHPRRPDSWMPLTVYVIASALMPFLTVSAMLAMQPRNEYGDSRWADNGLIKKMGLFAKRGVILGQRGSRFLRYDSPLSALCIAPPGAGKTSAVVIPNVLAFDGSAVILDKKGEISAATMDFKSTHSRVLLFDPASKNNKVKFNPLAKALLPKDWPDVIELVFQIRELLFQPGTKNDQSADHWLPEAKNLFAFFTLLLIHEYKDSKEEVSIPRVIKLMMMKEALQEEIAEAVKDDSLPEIILMQGRALAQKAYKEFSGIYSTVQTKLSVYLSPYTAASFEGNDFTPEEFRAQPTTLYIKVDEADVERLAPCIRLMQDFFIRRLMRREFHPGDREVLFLLDEFPRFGKIPVLLKLPALGRSYGLPALYFFQSGGQIVDIYGQEGLDELESTTAFKILLEINDEKTAEKYSKSIGNYTRWKSSSGSSTTDELRGSRSSNKSLEGAPLVTAADLMSMKSDNYMVVIASGYRKFPVKGKPAFWYKIPKMRRVTRDIRKVSV